MTCSMMPCRPFLKKGRGCSRLSITEAGSDCAGNKAAAAAAASIPGPAVSRHAVHLLPVRADDVLALAVPADVAVGAVGEAAASRVTRIASDDTHSGRA